jgi:zinc protease
MQELEQFYRTWYTPNNAVMVISGKFDKSSILQTIDKNFAQIPSRAVPAPVQVPALDPAKIQPRQFLVEKGSDLAKYNIYSNKSEPKLQPALALAPLLYTMQPSGHLYQNMVETGITTNVDASTWLDQDFNVVFLGAIYAPSNDPKKVESSLLAGIEKGKPFTEVELNRVKSLMKTQGDLITKQKYVKQVKAFEDEKKQNTIDTIADCNAVLTVRIGYEPKRKLKAKNIDIFEMYDSIEEGIKEVVKRYA